MRSPLVRCTASVVSDDVSTAVSSEPAAAPGKVASTHCLAIRAQYSPARNWSIFMTASRPDSPGSPPITMTLMPAARAASSFGSRLVASTAITHMNFTLHRGVVLDLRGLRVRVAVGARHLHVIVGAEGLGEGVADLEHQRIVHGRQAHRDGLFAATRPGWWERPWSVLPWSAPLWSERPS